MVKEILFRDNQILSLNQYIDSDWPLLEVHGTHGSGKTAVVKSVCESLNREDVIHSWIDLIEYSSSYQVFSKILYDVQSSYTEETDRTLVESCSSPSDFISKLADALEDVKKRKLVIVVDFAEHLIDFEANFLLFLLRLNEEVNIVVSVILVTCVPVKEHIKLSQPPIGIFFPAYTKAETSRILCLEKPDDVEIKVYENYVTLTVSVLHQITRNIKDAFFICRTNFERYMEPLKEKEVTESDTAKLWRHFEPILRKSIDNVVIKEVSSKESYDDMPFCEKYLLISGYLASYNSAKNDKRYFVKYQGHSKTRRYTIAKTDKVRPGPKAFALERLFHIYKALLELNSENHSTLEDVPQLSTQLLSHIENLNGLRLFLKASQTSGSPLSSTAKWRVSDALTLDYVNAVAKSVRFDLLAHLEQLAYKQ
ncbi:Origin recognition complex subunit 5 [Halotydeus destructor]|nr:Origin recognition complex subunit 5 [Halotydeus destructor]